MSQMLKADACYVILVNMCNNSELLLDN